MKTTHQIQVRALGHLSLEDQEGFIRFGLGLSQELPHLLIHHAIEEQVRLYPELTAVAHGEQQLTYLELNDQANHLAARLHKQGVRAGDHVGLFIERSPEMVVGILAVLKLGAAYVPQDARIMRPAQLVHVIETADLKTVLTLSKFRPELPPVEGMNYIEIDCDALEKHNETVAPLEAVHSNQNSAESPTCFVLFTSGTTGMPNGVCVTHKNVCNILLTDPGHLGMAPGLRVSQILNISFDMAAWEILGALSHGSTLIIRGHDIAATVAQVDIVIATPSILSAVDVQRCARVRVVAVAGEPCPKSLADAWSNGKIFYNACGPTEVTIVNTMQLYRGEQLTIGRPIPNNSVYILDEQLRPCAIGQIGEMWAGGDCVSKGYLKNDVLNQERYRMDPFLGGTHKMFRTRDLGRWNAQGELEHFGRTDDQVKIRGFRVELDSVSAALEKAHGCQKAVTLKLDSKTLVSFVSPRTVNLAEALHCVSSTLPYYCVPRAIIALDELPVTERGKTDKTKLTRVAVDRIENGVEHA